MAVVLYLALEWHLERLRSLVVHVSENVVIASEQENVVLLKLVKMSPLQIVVGLFFRAFKHVHAWNVKSFYTLMTRKSTFNFQQCKAMFNLIAVFYNHL